MASNITGNPTLLFLIFFINPYLIKESISQIFEKNQYEFFVSEESEIGKNVGKVVTDKSNENTVSYSIIAGNTNNTFAINENTGSITTAKRLNRHTQSKFILTVAAQDPEGSQDETIVNISIYKETEIPVFSTITWGLAANHPYGTHEIHGKAVEGKLYMFGGYDVQKQPNNWTPTKRSYVYDPNSNSWAAIADLPHEPKGEGFGGITHQGLATDGTDIYFAGGYTSNATGTGQAFGTKQCFKYNIQSNTYTKLPDLPEELAAGQLEYLNGKIHYMGGANKSRKDVKVHYALDLDNLGAGWMTLAPVSDGRNHPGSAVYEGKIYFIGGAHHQDHATIARKTVEVYDPENNVWSLVSDMPTARDHISSSVVVFGDKIIVLGGETAHNVRTSKVEAYDPSKDSWRELTPLPQSSAAGVASVMNNKIYFTGGDFRRTNRIGNPVFPEYPAPLVEITKPADKDSFKEGNEIIIEVDATIGEGSISKVEFFADDVKLGEDTETPYSFTWNDVDAGTYLLSAKAISNNNVSTTSSKIEINATSNIPPTVRITSPENGTIFLEGEPIVFEVAADDADGTVEKVEFHQGTTKIGETFQSPFAFNWNNATPETYDLSAKATDNEGGTTTSATVQVSVMRLNNVFPEISIVSPENGSEFLEGTELEITVEANDEDGSIQKVEFYEGSTKLGEILNEPYTYSWINVPSGDHEIIAIAYDNEGASTESEPVQIHVESIITCIKSGSLLREYWLDVFESEISSIPFDTPPTGTSEINLFEAPDDFADNYATRLRGYICPPISSDYTFWISSSHKSELYISSNEDPENKIKRAHSDGNPQDMWEHDGVQKSEPIHLIAGQIYYVEAIHLSITGADHFAVGWQWPNGRLERPITGESLIKYEDDLITNIENDELIEIFKVYPIPTPEKFYIELSALNKGNAVVEILNLQGVVLKKVFEGKITEGKLQRFEVERNSLASGVYFVRLITNDAHKIKRIIIN